MSTYLDPSSFSFRFLLGIITATQVSGTTILLPAIPAIAASLNASSDIVQLTLTGFLLGVGLGQVFCGALADRYGRRPVVLWGLALFSLAGIGATFSPTIGWLIAFRSIQGLGAASGMIVGRSMIRDVFQGSDAVKMMAFITSVISLVPMIAPTVGGVLLELFSWRATLAAVALSSALVAVLFALYVEETLRCPDPQATRPRRIAANARRYFRTPQCVGFAAVMVLSYGGLFSSMALLPYIAIEVLGRSTFEAGVSVGVVAFSVLLGSRASSFLAGRVSMRTTLSFSSSLFLLGSLIMLVLAHADFLGFRGFVLLALPAATMGFAFGLSHPNCVSASLEPVPDIAGLASAINGSLQMSVGGVFAFLGGVLFDGSASTLGICAALSGVTAFLAYFGYARRLASTAVC